MKVSELIEKLKSMPQDDEVMVKERYSEGVVVATVARVEYKNLEETYCFIG